MPRPDDLHLAAGLLAALQGHAVASTRDLAAVKAALARGEGPVPVELPWRERRAEGYMERHQLLLTALDAERATWINPLKTPGARPGDELGGPDAGPLRRLEADGSESLPLLSFLALWQLGGEALLPA